MSSVQPANVVGRFCDAAQHNDVDGMTAALAADAELVSPLFGRMVFRGRDDLRVLLGAVFGSLRGLQWVEFIGDGQIRVAVSQSRVAGVRITDAMIVELDESGQISRIRPHLRPWLALSLFALVLGPRVAGHPGVIRRALRRKARRG